MIRDINEQLIKQEQNSCIIIDNKMLQITLNQNEIQKEFFKLAIQANTVLCCRATPKQKSLVVNTSKKYLKHNITLAIGDGANDVPMIKEAHVGVAIRGKQGLQAHAASDYSITRFRFLERLLLVHGRLAYRRVAWMICYYFYKNLILFSAELPFAFMNGFSGQIYFASWLPQLYNALWTSWPCLFSYIFDKDDANLFHDKDDDKVIQRSKQLYSIGQKKKFFNFFIFWKWTLMAFYHGLICYFCPVIVFSGRGNYEGKTYQHWFVSSVSFSLVVFVVTLKLFTESVYLNRVNIVVGIVSLLFYITVLWFGCVNIISTAFNPEIAGVFVQILEDIEAIFLILLVPLVLLCFDMLLISCQYKICYRKTMENIWIDRIRQKQLDKQPLRSSFQ